MKLVLKESRQSYYIHLNDIQVIKMLEFAWVYICKCSALIDTRDPRHSTSQRNSLKYRKS